MANPQLNIPKTRLDRYVELLSITLALGSLFYVIYHWSALPSEVPTHFNYKGEPDDTGSAAFLFVIPALNVLLAVIFQVAIRFPHKLNYPMAVTEQNAATLYRASSSMLRGLALLLTLLLTYMTLGSIKTAMGESSGLNPYVMVFVIGGIVVNLIVYFVRIRKQA